MDRIRLLTVEPDLDSRARLRKMLRDHINELDLVGEASGAEDGLRAVDSSSPDIVLISIKLPGGDGLSLTRTVRQRYPTTGAILLTDEQEEEQLFRAISSGAAAYLPKDIGGDELLEVIRGVRTGKYIIDDRVLASPSLALRVLSAFRELTAVDKQVESLFAPLSPREKEVLEHAARGRSNREIARTMSISEQTVKNHLTSIMRKLAVNDRTHAVVYALQQGWITVPEL